MKKCLLLLFTAIILAGLLNFRYGSMPVFSLEKKYLYNGFNEFTGLRKSNLKVMTYNIHRGINRRNKLDIDGIVDTIKSADPDIVALQEVERFSVRTRFQDQVKLIADKLSMNYAYGKSINIISGQFGNAILSKYPIEEYEVVKLPSVKENRTLLKAVVSVSGTKITVYNTHLGLNQYEREEQVTEIKKIIGNNKRFILAGDFNSSVDKLGALTGTLKDCAAYTKGEKEKPTFENNEIRERIDYIFTSGDFRVKEYDVPESEASDHYPVISVLKLSN
ncbi:MAG: endonuclease/exonuclease/phosphatase family protein [Caulobacteraceae bacterium]